MHCKHQNLVGLIGKNCIKMINQYFKNMIDLLLISRVPETKNFFSRLKNFTIFLMKIFNFHFLEVFLMKNNEKYYSQNPEWDSSRKKTPLEKISEFIIQKNSLNFYYE